MRTDAPIVAYRTACLELLERNKRLKAEYRALRQEEKMHEYSFGELEPNPSPNCLYIEVCIPEHYSEETVEQTRKALELLAEYARLFAVKQEAYGRGNIDGFGELGVLVRLNDKVERLKNLIYRGKSNNLEAIEDTWLDVLGYGLIGLMIRRGRW